MLKRSLALILALVMLAAICVGCANTSDNNGDDQSAVTTTTAPAGNEPAGNDTTAQTGDETTAPAETTADPSYIADIPADLDFGGKTINILATAQAFSKDEFDAQSMNGSVVNDAVYERNLAVEDALGVRLNVILADPSSVYKAGDAVRNAVATGDKAYDLATMPGYTHTSYVLEGDFYDLMSVENLDLDKLYWTQGFNQIMCNGTRQYVASGAYSISMYRNMYITLYNKPVFQANGLEDLYDLVKADKWTFTKQTEMVANLYNDLNGNSERDASDFYGFVTGANTSVDPYWVGFNMPILSLTDGVYAIDYDTEKLIDIVTNVQNMLFRNEGVYCVGKSGTEDGSDKTVIISQFAAGNAAMCTTMIFQIENYLTPNNFEPEYGIAPIPKYDDNQEDYYTHVQDQLTVMGIVATVSQDDLPMMGAVMETIAEQSYKHVFPAYYENALSYKYLQNPQSVEMLDLIYHSIKVEGTFIYSSKFAMLGQLRTIVSNDNNRISSVLKGYNRKWSSGATELNEGLEKLSH